MKLNLGCGDKKIEGFINVDIEPTEAADQLVDLFQFPWPWEDGSVEEVRMVHFFEHIPAKLRGKIADEVYRVLQVGGTWSLSVPSYNSYRYYQDFTHEWPPIVPGSFYYFNRSWREHNKLQHGPYDLKCDFDATYGWNLTPEWKLKAVDVQQFGAEHYWNTTNDLVVNLTKRG